MKSRLVCLNANGDTTTDTLGKATPPISNGQRVWSARHVCCSVRRFCCGIVVSVSAWVDLQHVLSVEFD